LRQLHFNNQVFDCVPNSMKIGTTCTFQFDSSL